MQTHNVHSHNLKGYKSEHSMNTCLSEDLQVAKEETLHVSLGKVTSWKRPRQKNQNLLLKVKAVLRRLKSQRYVDVKDVRNVIMLNKNQRHRIVM